MSFFQNLFDEFRGHWLLDDRQYSLTFRVNGNKNRSDYQYAWNPGSYDLSAGGVLTFNYAWDTEFKNYSVLTVDVTGAIPAATTAHEIVTILNANTSFAEFFVAQVRAFNSASTLYSVLITANQSRPKKEMKLWIGNSGAELKMRFNKGAGVAELPSYFSRHTIDNRFNFVDSVGTLILLDETDPTDQGIIEEAGFVPADMLADWELVAGRALGVFKFSKMTVDVSDRITETIEYPAGAKEGDLARKINYTYSGANKSPDQITQIPYVLQAADLVTP